MAPPTTVKSLANTDAAYIAGMIDGEGTITLTREHKNESRRLVVSISSTEKCLLEHIHNAIGAGKITNKRTYKPEHSPSYHYKITNRQALSLLEQVTPFMKGYKAERAKYALQHYLALTPRNGRYSAAQRQQRELFEENLLKILPNSNMNIAE